MALPSQNQNSKATNPAETAGTKPPTTIAALRNVNRPTLLDLHLSPLHKQLLFEIDSRNTQVIDRYSPEFIACGAEHLVYAFSEHPTIVAKLHVDDILFGYCEKRGRSLASRNLVSPSERVSLEQNRFEQLGKYFPVSTTLRQHVACLPLEISKLMLVVLTEDRTISQGEKMVVGVTVQQVAPELQHPEHRALTAGYAELDDPARESYASTTARYVYGDTSQPNMPLTMRYVQPRLWQSGFMTLLSCDSAFRKTVKNFTECAARYVNGTGEGLDIFGNDNVVFAPSATGWKYRLVDALYPLPHLQSDAFRGLEKTHLGQSIDARERLAILNYVNMTRTINFLAEMCGTYERIAPLPAGLRVPGDRLLSVLR